jgi:hypothetical protein
MSRPCSWHTAQAIVLVHALCSTFGGLGARAPAPPIFDPKGGEVAWFSKAAARARSTTLAICATGQIRSLVHLGLRESWIRNLLEPSNAALFLHARAEQPSKVKASSGAYNVTAGTVASPNPVWARLSTAQAQATVWGLIGRGLVSARISYVADDVSSSARALAATDADTGIAQALATARDGEDDGSAECHSQVEEPVNPRMRTEAASCVGAIVHAERVRGSRYAYIMRIRPDLISHCWWPQLPPPPAGSTGRHVLRINDLWFLAQRELGLALLGLKRPNGKPFKRCVGGCNSQPVCMASVLKAHNGIGHDACYHNNGNPAKRSMTTGVKRCGRGHLLIVRLIDWQHRAYNVKGQGERIAPGKWQCSEPMLKPYPELACAPVNLSRETGAPSCFTSMLPLRHLFA